MNKILKMLLYEYFEILFQNKHRKKTALSNFLKLYLKLKKNKFFFILFIFGRKMKNNRSGNGFSSKMNVFKANKENFFFIIYVISK